MLIFTPDAWLLAYTGGVASREWLMNTQITFVLDLSGSMAAIKDDTIGGFNAFLDDQRDEEGVATVTLYDFNTQVKCMYRARPIEEAPKLFNETYSPGGTRLSTTPSTCSHGDW